MTIGSGVFGGAAVEFPTFPLTYAVARLAVDMDIHGYIHGYIHVWISDLDRAVDISMDINARSLTFFYFKYSVL